MIDLLFSLLKPFYVVTSFQTAFFCILAFSMRSHRKYFEWLWVLLFSLSVKLTLFTLKWHFGINLDAPVFKFVIVVFEFSIGPLFYLFLIKATQQKIKFKTTSALLLTPFVIAFLFLYIPQNQWDSYGSQFHTFLGINFQIHSTLFLFLTYRKFKKYEIEIKNHITQNLLYEVKLIRIILNTLVLILFFGFLGSLVRVIYQFELAILNPILEFMVLLSVNASFLIALKIPYQLTQLNLGTEAYENISLVEKYKNSTLSEEQKNEIELKLNELVVLEKYYRTSNLTIHELSQRINIQSKFISQVINELHSQNFCEYINAIRIDEAKSILRDNNFAHKTILEVCYEVGFNSKSTFNAVFKKQTGRTPSEYRNSYFQRSR